MTSNDSTLQAQSLAFARRESELCRFTAKAALMALEMAQTPAERGIASEACIESLRRYRAAVCKLHRKSRLTLG